MEPILKSDFMLKRSQNKGQMFYKENYSKRWFELTPSVFRYKDGTPETGANKIKGYIHLAIIRSVEIANPENLGGRDNAFQVTYKVMDSIMGDFITLYVIAFHEKQRDEWIMALKKASTDAGGLHGNRYHPSIWVGKSFACCGHISRRDEGCQNVSSLQGAACPVKRQVNPEPFVPHRENNLTHTLEKVNIAVPKERANKELIKPPERPNKEKVQPPERANKELVQPPVPLPRKNVPPKAQTSDINKTVLALYDYKAMGVDHLDLLMGEEYTLVEEPSSTKPFKVKNKDGLVGYVPQNYVQMLTGNENNFNLFEWFYGKTTKGEAEQILKEDGREGCFLVRESARDGYKHALSVYTRRAKNIDNVEDPFTTKHYHIKTTETNQFYLNDKHLFDSLPQLIYYHKRNSAGLTVRLKCNPRDKIKPPPLLDMMEIQLKDLDFKEELGVGQFGKVQKAIYMKNTVVAVKTMKEGMMSEIDFLEEAKSMAKLQHPNLVQLYGVCLNPLMIVTECMKHGALVQYLKRNENIFSKDVSKLLDICLQVCEGMKYLEEQKVIHRDLAARNCLVGEKQIIKVCDFGLARYVPDDQYESALGSRFPFRWSSPEVMAYTRFSSKSDVWAFGILMWEVYTFGLLVPFNQLKTNQEVADFVCLRNGRPDRPTHCSQDIYSIMLKTWEQNPDSRPSFEKLCSLLEENEED